MSIIRVTDNKNNRWKRNAKTKEKKQKQKKQKTKTKKRTRGTEAIVKEWEANDFVKHMLGFNQLICKVSLNSSVKFRVSFTNYFKWKRITWVEACCRRV